MSEPKFSKGPWRIQWPVPSAGECRKIRTAEGTAIMGDATYYPWTTERTADWFLMTASPEMYEFIESIQLDSAADEIRRDRLLAKARGEL